MSANVNGISFLERNLVKIHGDNLSGNKKAISILEKNLDKINWYKLSYNGFYLDSFLE